MTPNIYFTTLGSPLGELTITATDKGLCGLFFADHKYWPVSKPTWLRDDGARFDAARQWLGDYFAGSKPARLPPLDFAHGTEFQHRVWHALQSIAPGQTKTYSEIAQIIGLGKAVRAVGTAIGKNPLSILVPCHRVIGSNGSLTGFAGGVDRKRWLLTHEGVTLH
jgi:methylated-DNA-[protein]-cysteine S-methyltransferase